MDQDDLKLFAGKLLDCLAPGEDPAFPEGAIKCKAKGVLLSNHPSRAAKAHAVAPAMDSSTSAKPASASVSADSPTPKVEMFFDNSAPNFSKDPSFKVTHQASGVETVSPAGSAFAYISELSLQDVYKAEQYVGQLKSFRKPTESQRKELEKQHPEVFNNYNEVNPGKVLSFLASSNPYATFDAFDAIARILEQVDLLTKLLPNSAEVDQAGPGSSASAAGAAAIPTGSAAGSHLLAHESDQFTTSKSKINSISQEINNQVGKLSGAISTTSSAARPLALSSTITSSRVVASSRSPS